MKQKLIFLPCACPIEVKFDLHKMFSVLPIGLNTEFLKRLPYTLFIVSWQWWLFGSAPSRIHLAAASVDWVWVTIRETFSS